MNTETRSYIPKELTQAKEGEPTNQLLTMIEAKREEKADEPVIVMVAGRTSSGKTSAVTSEITRKFGEDARVISMDDYSKGNSFVSEMASRGTPINWDHPAYIDFELLNQHIEALKRGEAIDKPTFSFKTGERAQSDTFNSGGVIVVEGLFALRDEIQEHGDVKAFVDISLHGSIIRRLLRDVKRTNMEPVDIMRYYLTTVEPMYQEHIVGTKENADIVIVNEYNPKSESSRSEVYEVQAKFRTPEDIKTRLQRAGAEYLGQVQEEDSYLKPTDKDFGQSDEVIRIRKKGDTIILGYKGPRIESSVRTRAKFEFEIDEEIEKNILEKYGDKVTDIAKIRNLYQLDGLIIAIDSNVIKKQGNDGMPLGSFVEIRSTDQDHGEEKIKNVSERLALDYNTRITSSYSEM